MGREVKRQKLFNTLESDGDIVKPSFYYMLMRQLLMAGYGYIGIETLSTIAFRLAAENALDWLCMS